MLQQRCGISRFALVSTRDDARYKQKDCRSGQVTGQGKIIVHAPSIRLGLGWLAYRMGAFRPSMLALLEVWATANAGIMGTRKFNT